MFQRSETEKEVKMVLNKGKVKMKNSYNKNWKEYRFSDKSPWNISVFIFSFLSKDFIVCNMQVNQYRMNVV